MAPNSGLMLLIVARSASPRRERPAPWNSTNLPTTPWARSISVTVSTRSVAVVPGRSAPSRRKPTTTGSGWYSGWPRSAASASIPPTPQPTTPRPLIMVVCESVPTSVSGKAVSVPSGSGRAVTTSARYSRLTWWTMPVPGGTTRKLANAPCAQRRRAYRSPLRSYSRSTLIRNAASDPYWSTWTEWSMTRSAGTSGLTLSGSPPMSAIASRMAARSTTHGTPVKSWRMTRAGRNGSSIVPGSVSGRQAASVARSLAVTRPLPDAACRAAFSMRTLTVYGSRSRSGIPRAVRS